MTALAVLVVESISLDAKTIVSFTIKVHRFEKLAYAPASLLGGHSVCDPPDPIPNSAVKPDSADGTRAQALEE